MLFSRAISSFVPNRLNSLKSSMNRELPPALTPSILNIILSPRRLDGKKILSSLQSEAELGLKLLLTTEEVTREVPALEYLLIQVSPQSVEMYKFSFSSGLPEVLLPNANLKET